MTKIKETLNCSNKCRSPFKPSTVFILIYTRWSKKKSLFFGGFLEPEEKVFLKRFLFCL